MSTSPDGDPPKADTPDEAESVGPTMKWTATKEDGTEHSIVLPAPTSIVMSRVRPTVAGELADEEAVAEYMSEMFEDQDARFEHYVVYQSPKDPSLQAAIDRGDIVEVEAEPHYYRRPDSERSFMHILPSDAAEFENLAEMVRAGPSYVRRTLRLSTRKLREYETFFRIELEDRVRRQRHDAQFTFDVFLSYAVADQQPAESVRAKLAASGARVFMAPKELAPGDDFAERIREALRGSTEVWVLVSPSSVKSEWVTTEWGAAWVLGRRIVPILYRCDVPTLPDRLRRVQCVDLSDVEALIASRAAAREAAATKA
jgi:hypothetical protein